MQYRLVSVFEDMKSYDCRNASETRDYVLLAPADQ